MAQRQQPRVDPHEEEREANHRVLGGRIECVGCASLRGIDQEVDSQHQAKLQVIMENDALPELKGREALRPRKEEREGYPEPHEGANEPAWAVQDVECCVHA